MPADIFNFEDTQRCEQGATFDRAFVFYDGLTEAEQFARATNAMTSAQEAAIAAKLMDLTGHTARMQIRSSIASGSTVLSLTTENGRISIDGEAGEVSLLISATDTASLSAGDYVYDLELITGSTVKRIAQGRFIVDGEVTR